MKRLYFLVGALLAFTAGYAQTARQIGARVIDAPKQGDVIRKPSARDRAKGGDEELTVFWSEDFSNGLDGQAGNGAWTVGGDQGDLWFHTYPAGLEDGYDPYVALPEEYQDVYGLHIPNWAFGYEITLDSETADNGYMMIDVDRWNSTAVEGDEPGNPTTLSNAAHASLTSPSFSLEGVEYANLSFYQDWRMCCNNYNLTAELSVDGGDTWVIYDLFEYFEAEGNLRITGNAAIDISDVLAGAATLDDCRVRFQWDPGLLGSMSHYYLILDDISIVEIPENDLVIGKTWYNEWFEQVDDVDLVDADYLGDLQYSDHPYYVKEPFNFACEVTNMGTEIQTDVRLVVTINGPSEEGLSETYYSEAITLESGASDTIRIYGIEPEMWVMPEVGEYSIDYEVTQAETEQRPSDNIGASSFFEVNGDEGFGIMGNDRNNISHYPFAGDDFIWANRFVFEDITGITNLAITHVEFVLQTGGSVDTEVGEICFPNVRRGSVLEEESVDNELFRYFGDDELEFTIEEESLTQSGGDLNWVSYLLPEPILVEPNTIYQAELELPAIGDDVVFIGLSDRQETYAGVFYDFSNVSSGPNGWWYDGGNLVPLLRFRLSLISSVDKITYESGIKLTQNYPNPFAETTSIQFQLDATSEVFLEVYDMNGKLVRDERLGMIPANSAQVYEFDAQGLAPGTYTYSIRSNDHRVTRKMTIE